MALLWPYNEFYFLTLLLVIVFSIPFLRRSFIPIPSENITTTIKKNEKGRYVVFDVLRGIALIAVIIIHAVYIFEANNVVLEGGKVIDACMRFAMPVFYLTSGLLLKPPARSVQGYFLFLWDKAKALLPAYLLVTGVLALAQGLTWKAYWLNVVTGKGSVPFYFIVILFQLYLIYPFLVRWAQKRQFVYATFFFSIVMQFLYPTWYLFGNPEATTLALQTGVPTMFRFIFFFVWGIYMREQLLRGKLVRTYIPWVAILIASVTVYAIVPGQLYNMRPFYGLAIVMLLFLFFTSGRFYSKLELSFAWVGSMSLWIFLTHFPLMEYIIPLLLNTVSTTPYVMFVVATLISIAVSIPVGYVSKKIYDSGITILKVKVR